MDANWLKMRFYLLSIVFSTSTKVHSEKLTNTELFGDLELSFVTKHYHWNSVVRLDFTEISTSNCVEKEEL